MRDSARRSARVQIEQVSWQLIHNLLPIAELGVASAWHGFPGLDRPHWAGIPGETTNDRPLQYDLLFASLEQLLTSRCN